MRDDSEDGGKQQNSTEADMKERSRARKIALRLRASLIASAGDRCRNTHDLRSLVATFEEQLEHIAPLRPGGETDEQAKCIVELLLGCELGRCERALYMILHAYCVCVCVCVRESICVS